MEHQMVIFNLANEHYGLEIAAVESIIKLQAITRLPRAPQFVEGVINLRGKVLPIIDLRKRFGLEAEAATNDSRIVVVHMNAIEVGMIVDGVSEVVSISSDVIEPPSPIVATVDSAFIRGIAKSGDRLVILLDMSQVLSPQEQATLQSIPAVA
jgi:purine-binding chemotaxis protein CheW